MKTRLNRNRLKEKELTEASQTTNTRHGSNLRRSNLDLKSETGRVAKAKSKNKADLLPDQQSEQELYYDFSPCCVKVRRLKPAEVSNSNNGREGPNATSSVKKSSGQPQDRGIRRFCVRIPRLVSNVTSRAEPPKEAEEQASCYTGTTVLAMNTSNGPEEQIVETANANMQVPQDSISNKSQEGTNATSIVENSSGQSQDRGIRRFCVRIPRLESNITSISDTPKEAEKQDSCSTGTTALTMNTSNGPEEQIVETENTDMQVPQGASSTSTPSNLSENTRYSFRNPALALTKRRAQEKGLIKTTAREIIEDKALNKCTPQFEPNKNSTMNVSSASQQARIQPSKENQDIFLRNLPNEFREMQENNKESNMQSYGKKNKETLKAKEDNKTRNTRRKKVTNKSPAHNTSKEADIYEFLSQSQSSGSESDKHKDPAADIIKRMIEQGKVQVTKNYKGKPIIVHRKGNKKTTIKRRQVLQTNKKTALELRNRFQPTHAAAINEEEHVHLDNAVQSPVQNIETRDAANSPNKTMKRKSHSSTAAANQGTFSSLARSVLVQQTNHTNSMRKNTFDRERLLEITRKYVSTPLRKPVSITENVNLSPIPKATNERDITLGSASNNFDSNISYRPSLPEIELNATFSNETMRPTSSSGVARQQSSLSSSFSSNDSNAENMPPPPPPSVTGTRTNDENAVIFDARQTLNPRRTLGNRSPLKTINIIDVITLPPYKGPIKPNNDDNLKRNEESLQHIDFEEYSNDERSETCEELNNNNEEAQALFGFEEYLDTDQTELSEASINISKNKTSSSNSNSILHKKLKNLKKFRPDVQHYKHTKNSTITKQIFDDDFNKKRGHQDIRNLLCSTMINAPSKKAGNTTIASTLDSSDDSDDVRATTSKGNAVMDLFGDPESTFNEKSLHRTYERPIKRKRKLQHQYSVVFDSEDETDNEDEHNTSVVKKTKRQEKQEHQHKENDKELNKFVSEFNSMLKEAEEYELIIE